jgi:hypothetical protein
VPPLQSLREPLTSCNKSGKVLERTYHPTPLTGVQAISSMNSIFQKLRWIDLACPTSPVSVTPGVTTHFGYSVTITIPFIDSAR